LLDNCPLGGDAGHVHRPRVEGSPLGDGEGALLEVCLPANIGGGVAIVPVPEKDEEPAGQDIGGATVGEALDVGIVEVGDVLQPCVPSHVSGRSHSRAPSLISEAPTK
jgi:hypothetical protein